MNKPTRVAALLTCYNRRAKTLKCLEALYQQTGLQDVQLSTYLVDDGSTDGTSDAVKQRFPKVILIQGTGQLYWNGGMRVAFEEAMESDYDFYLWLNDDTYLYEEALQSLVTTYEGIGQSQDGRVIVVGSTCDPTTQEITYGGLCRSSHWHPFKFSRVQPQEFPKACETMNGNCVLIPRQVVQLIGNLDFQFSHRYGDIDYGLRAQKAGCSIWITPGYVGICPQNILKPIQERIKELQSPTGLPIKEQQIFAKRHGGFFWPLFMLLPYIRLYSKQLLPLAKSY